MATGSPHSLLTRLLFCLSLLISPLAAADSHLSDGSLPRIAHAGGGFKNWQYTNSLDALDFNRDHFTLFEIDLAWTRDGALVCLHDWGQTAEWIFQRRFEQPSTLAEFEQLVASHPHARSCTLTTLIDWLNENPNKRLVTDIKERNLQGLARLAELLGDDVAQRVIPQIYTPEEYAAARQLGYRDIIWTLYRYDGDIATILDRASGLDLYAITMPRHLAEAGLGQALKARGIASYVHTLNTQREIDRFRDLGIDEVYTDWIPAD
jgi:glycerophosphoryl diester phosphodiesterase